MSTPFDNYSMLTGQRYDHDWYDWCIFASGDPAELRLIQAIEYTLHPSFPEPVRIITDSGHRFALASNGWGSFMTRIRVMFADGREEFTSYSIKLETDAWPRKRPEVFSTHQEELIWGILSRGSHRWRTAEALQRKTGFCSETVRQALFELEQQDLARKSPFRSIDKKDLWGATEIVGVTPRL